MKTLQVRLSNDLRDAADNVLDEIGMDMSTAIRIYLKKVVQSRSIPFPLEALPTNMEVIEVDDVIQKQMDQIGEKWNQLNK